MSKEQAAAAQTQAEEARERIDKTASDAAHIEVCRSRERERETETERQRDRETEKQRKRRLEQKASHKRSNEALRTPTSHHNPVAKCKQQAEMHKTKLGCKTLAPVCATANHTGAKAYQD